jgi:predicted lipoprotein with Yx(FWY)xxD motif
MMIWTMTDTSEGASPRKRSENYNSAAYTIVTVEDALRYWAPDARSLYCAVADLDPEPEQSGCRVSDSLQ